MSVCVERKHALCCVVSASFTLTHLQYKLFWYLLSRIAIIKGQRDYSFWPAARDTIAACISRWSRTAVKWKAVQWGHIISRNYGVFGGSQIYCRLAGAALLRNVDWKETPRAKCEKVIELSLAGTITWAEFELAKHPTLSTSPAWTMNSAPSSPLG